MVSTFSCDGASTPTLSGSTTVSDSTSYLKSPVNVERCAGNMSDRAPESGFVDPFGDDRGKQKTWDLHAADQTVCRGGGRAPRGGGVPRLRRAGAGRTLNTQLAVEIRALAPLENPGIHQSESAVAQKQDGAGKEPPLSPLQNASDWFFPNYQPHLAPFPPSGGSLPPM